MFLQLSHLEHPRTALPPKLQYLPQNEVQEGVTQTKRRIRLYKHNPVMVNKIRVIDNGAVALHKQMGRTEVEMMRL